MTDLDVALQLCPGTKKINLHASYAIFDEENGGWVDRDRLEPKHFKKWVDFCKARGLGCDFNPTFFSHPKCDPLTLSSPNPETRRFWIDHGKACIRISQYLAQELGQPCVMNIWTGDGFKDIPADRMGPRMRYKASIDEILSEPYDFNLVKPCVESKVFGIGVEAYTAGSAEFALSYAAMNRDRCIPLMDNGHYHPTEVVSDKIPALLAFFPEIALHITRGVRWDSDHVVLFDDETKEIAKEIVRCGGLEGRVKIALDYFDASINRIFAWVTGFRNVQKALLFALLQPTEQMQALQDAGRFTELMLCAEQLKTMPFPAVWGALLRGAGRPRGGRRVVRHRAGLRARRALRARLSAALNNGYRSEDDENDGRYSGDPRLYAHVQRRLAAGLARAQRRKPHLPHAPRGGRSVPAVFHGAARMERDGRRGGNLGGEYFITTGSGKFLRNVQGDPAHNIGIVEINGAGDRWRIVWGLEDGARPTSEFPSHFLNHSVRKAATGGVYRVIYHAHTPNLIAMTYILPLTARDFTRALWQSATECPVVFPGGVGVVEWMVPGGADIAVATSELMKRYDAAVWAHHGLFVSGPDFDTAFGLMHTIEKAAQIYMLALSAGGGEIRQTITDDNLRAIAKEFGVTLNEEFLD